MIECLPPQSVPTEIVCSVYSDKDKRDLMITTFDTISRYSMIAPFTALKTRISEIGFLHPDWNGDGAVVPSERILKNAFKFLDCVINQGFASHIKPDGIAPTPYGTIDFDFQSAKGLVSVEIGNGQIGFFTEYNDKEDIMSEGINTDFKSIPLCLQEALFDLEEHIYANAICI